MKCELKGNSELYYKINNLLSYLRASHAVDRVNDYYAQFNNDAPGKVIQREMDELQKILDNCKG